MTYWCTWQSAGHAGRAGGEDCFSWFRCRDASLWTLPARAGARSGWSPRLQHLVSLPSGSQPPRPCTWGLGQAASLLVSKPLYGQRHATFPRTWLPKARCPEHAVFS